MWMTVYVIVTIVALTDIFGMVVVDVRRTPAQLTILSPGKTVEGSLGAPLTQS